MWKAQKKSSRLPRGTQIYALRGLPWRTERAGRHSPIGNKIEKYILFVSCHRNSGKKETVVMYSDLDSWNMAWVESSSQVLAQIPPATRPFLTWNEIACFTIRFLKSVNCFLLFYEPPMPKKYSILNKYLLNVY